MARLKMVINGHGFGDIKSQLQAETILSIK